MNFLDLIWLIPLFPAAGFVINGLFGKRMQGRRPVTLPGAVRSRCLHAGAVYQLQLPDYDRSHVVTVYSGSTPVLAATGGCPLPVSGRSCWITCLP
jgi:hypothetical protein